MRTHRNQHGACPHCGARQDAATEATAALRPPRPGDVSICIRCAGVSVFEVAGERRLPSDDEAATFAADDDLQRMVAAAKAMHL